MKKKKPRVTQLVYNARFECNTTKASKIPRDKAQAMPRIKKLRPKTLCAQPESDSRHTNHHPSG